MCAVAVVNMARMAAGTDWLVSHDWRADKEVTRAIDNERGSIARVFQIVSDPSPDRMREARERSRDNQIEYDDALKKLGPYMLDAPGQAALADAAAAGRAYDASMMQIIALVDAGRRDEAAKLAYGDTYDKLHAFADKLRALSQYQAKLAGETMHENDRLASLSRTIMIVATLLAAAIGAALAWAVTRRITGPLARAVSAANRVASGDLTTQLTAEGRDEIADLLHALNRMTQNLADVLREVANVSAAVTSASQEIASGNLDLSQRTEEQAAALEQTAASMEELTSTVSNNTGHAHHANEMAERMSRDVGAGTSAVEEVVVTMQGITESSRNVEGIISVIEGIAFQTNILALNAAVEAARAGEQGRGFAVVAGEVRTLAQRSATAAREIRDLIAESASRVGAGADIVRTTGDTMAGIHADVVRVSGLIAEIASASDEQSRGIGQVGTAISQMDHATQRNAALVEEVAAAAQSLAEQARRLQHTLARFRFAREAVPA
ncbi:methyl-accepting chemotaxis protein [Trinickia caryophylli]|nr:methyl-accepting chemotaxis protein [Trinickia caryophylli]WQE13378.1 methyl-accepting chemotaxis protein [Trinickia caryophylli]GLU34104.1 hypothetical protein Busp01_39460 [Trinickia caryophylli]